MSTQEQPPLIHFTYTFSPYAKRISTYLALRKILHLVCQQPITLPRPTLLALGIHYRRIPLLAIGRSLHADTRLILQTLETLYPPSASHPSLSGPKVDGLASLLATLNIDASVFSLAAQLLPSSLPMMKDAAFLRDREDFTGRSWDAAQRERGRVEAITGMRKVFGVYEALLQDGREWIAGTEGISLADVEGAWCLDWVEAIPGALEERWFGRQLWPRTFEWLERYRGVVKKAIKDGPRPREVGSEEAIGIVVGSGARDEVGIDENDPTEFKKGQVLRVWPVDTGSKHKDEGRLVGLTKDEVVLAVKTEKGDKEVYLHCPRWGFRIAPAQETGKL